MNAMPPALVAPSLDWEGQQCPNQAGASIRRHKELLRSFPLNYFSVWGFCFFCVVKESIWQRWQLECSGKPVGACKTNSPFRSCRPVPHGWRQQQWPKGGSDPAGGGEDAPPAHHQRGKEPQGRLGTFMLTQENLSSA